MSARNSRRGMMIGTQDEMPDASNTMVQHKADSTKSIVTRTKEAVKDIFRSEEEKKRKALYRSSGRAPTYRT